MSEPTGIGTGSGFVQDLDSPEQSLRLQSIEQCFSRGSSDVILQALLGRQVQETDPECQALLGGAISAVRRRLAKALPRTLPTDPEVFAAFFKEQGPADRLEILADLTAAQVRAFSAVAPALLAEEAEGLTAASIVRTFGRSWPKDALQVLGRSLGAPSISLRAAALDVLAQLAPQSLLRELPKLLIGRDPRLRALAIKGLLPPSISMKRLSTSRHCSRIRPLPTSLPVSRHAFTFPSAASRLSFCGSWPWKQIPGFFSERASCSRSIRTLRCLIAFGSSPSGFPRPDRRSFAQFSRGHARFFKPPEFLGAISTHT